MAKARKLSVGSVSTGTLSYQHLIPVFEDTLKSVRGGTSALFQLRGRFDTAEDYMVGLMDVLNEFCPSFCYFGAHEGNSSDFGCWPCEEAISGVIADKEGIRISDLSEVPKAYTGDVFVVTDHGNMSHYRCINGRLYCQWSIV